MSVLLVTSSPRGPRSESTALAEALLDAAGPLDVDRMDLFADPLPPFGPAATAAKMAVIAGAEPTGAAAEAWAAIQRTADRVRAADTLVFTVPMWNGGIPWALKLFIDTVTQPGIAFRFDPVTGYSGLLGGRRAIAIYTSQVYAPGVPPQFGVDHHSTYFDDWLRFIGVTRIDTIRLQPTYPGRPDLEAARAAATEQARRLGAGLGQVAA